MNPACEGKRSYETRREARRVAVRMRRQQREDITEYRCPCGSWHVGHTPRRTRRAYERAVVAWREGGTNAYV